MSFGTKDQITKPQIQSKWKRNKKKYYKAQVQSKWKINKKNYYKDKERHNKSNTITDDQ